MKLRSVAGKISAIWLFLLGLTLAVPAVAKQIPPRPEPARFVNDFAGVLDEAQRKALEAKLQQFDDSTSTQVVIVIDRSLEDAVLFDYVHELASTWGIGQEGKDNGLLMYVALNERKIRIHVGGGLQGVIPDIIANRIINTFIKPNFRNGEYYEGLDQATDAIIQASRGEFKADPKNGKGGRKKSGLISLVAVFVFIILVGIIGRRNRGNRGNRGGFGGGFFGGPFIGGGFGGGFGGGGSGFGGGSSFGGGSFNGGGASGSW